MKKFEFKKKEKKWKKKWQEWQLDKIKEDQKKPKKYILDMFPYPSGHGLHVGHPKGYIATDILARYYKMKGFNVLHPMGWDAFGLPAENFALKNKIHPEIATNENIKRFKNQLNKIGLNYDWSREIKTTDPEFYKFTQLIFLKMYNSFYDEDLDRARPIVELENDPFLEKKANKAQLSIQDYINSQRLVYESFEPINWCPACQTGLANEDLENGHCERCGSLVEKKPMRQWVIRITKYAHRLLKDLNDLSQWEDFIKEMQKNWIGQSIGAQVKFLLKLKNSNFKKEVEIFTTRIDTIFGCSYLVMSPEHELVQQLKNQFANWEEIKNYLDKIKNKSDLQRTQLEKEKTGVFLKNLVAINPVNSQEIPVLISDYVLKDYGSGVVMGVPAHDERDWQFAQKYDLKIKKVIDLKDKNVELPFIGTGFLINSGKYDGLSTNQAKEKILKDLEKDNKAKKQINYKIRDWVFSRQRYWGEPIPLLHCEKCGVVAMAEKDLPLTLPKVDHYQPSGTGESPLANIKDWVEVTCPKCGGKAKRETNTMPQWAGSSWYYLRYMDPDNSCELVSPQKEKYWKNVDIYVGGTEHATRHLIYARFWHKFLYDVGIVTTKEPFVQLQHVGLIMASDGRKMSKRFNNVINPDDVIAEFGADVLRLYEMFLGPFDQAVAWNQNGLSGVKKFVDKVFNLQFKVVNKLDNQERQKYLSLLHQTIEKVDLDIREFKFNTAVSALMILVNKLEKFDQILRSDFLDFVAILAPLAPFVCEELNEILGNKESIFYRNFPQADRNLMKTVSFILPIQINGKVRDKVVINEDLKNKKEEILDIVKKKENIKKYLEGKEIKKVIYVEGRILNIIL